MVLRWCDITMKVWLSSELCLQKKCVLLFVASRPKLWVKSISTISHRITVTTKTKQLKIVVHESIEISTKCWKHLQNISIMLQVQNIGCGTMSTSRSVGIDRVLHQEDFCFFSCYTLTSQSVSFLKLRDQRRHHGDVETIRGLVHQPSIHTLKEAAADSCLLDLPPLEGFKGLGRDVKDTWH